MSELIERCPTEAFGEESAGWGGDPERDYQPVVLVVGREDALGEMVAAELSDYGVSLSSDVETVLAWAITNRPDAIILADDLGDPEVWELSRKFHETKGLRRTPIMVYSTIKNEGRMRVAVEAGVYDLLFRPFSRTELGLRVRNMVRSRLYLRKVEEKNTVLNIALADLKESEAMLVQAEKLSQLGEMSAGIVHEINNPLNYSHTAIYMLKGMVAELEGGPREEFEEVVGDIHEGLERVSQIVRDLRAFATRSGVDTAELNLAAVVQTAARLLGHKLSNIAFDSNVPEEIWVYGNENQVCQVILNLLKNGVEATEEANRPLSEAHITVVAEEVKGRVALRVRDNGCGIGMAQQGKVFAPFFSKKRKGMGMGLGLSICRRIMEEHGGAITVDSEEGCFTEFTLDLPQWDPGAAEEGEREAHRVLI